MLLRLLLKFDKNLFQKGVSKKWKYTVALCSVFGVMSWMFTLPLIIVSFNYLNTWKFLIYEGAKSIPAKLTDKIDCVGEMAQTFDVARGNTNVTKLIISVSTMT